MHERCECSQAASRRPAARSPVSTSEFGRGKCVTMRKIGLRERFAHSGGLDVGGPSARHQHEKLETFDHATSKEPAATASIQAYARFRW